MSKPNASPDKKSDANAASGPDSSNLLRPEAAPLPYEALTKEQQEAGDKAVMLLQEMAGMAVPNVSRDEDHPYLPEIDQTRYNHVVLIDGRRGAGKSGLLVTLVQSLRDIATGATPVAEFKTLKPGNRIVPVGLIDLQPLPEDTNLLFYLLGHLEQVVRSLERKQGTARGRVAQPWEDGDLHSLSSRNAWREFTRAAAFGWRGSHTERRKSLDPESFAIEVEHGELERIDVIRRFRLFVDALANDYLDMQHAEFRSLPFFLLSIDDADMNPKRSGELLELVRKLWHPRLGFLLTGDTELFLTMLGVSFQEQFKTEKSEKARSLAYDVYNKIIPHRQRCELPPLPPEDRLDYPEHPESLKATLRKFNFQTQKKETNNDKQGRTKAGASPAARASVSLEKILEDLKERSKGLVFRRPLNLEDLFQEGPHFSEALPDRVRSILSLQHELDDIQRFESGSKRPRTADQPTDNLPRAIHQIWEHALESAQAPATEVNRLRQMVRLVRLDTEIGLTCDSLPIKVKAQDYHVESRQLKQGWVARLGAIRQLEIAMPGAGKKTSFPFPPRLRGAFLAAHEVAHADDRGALVGSRARRVARDAPFVNVVWNSGRYGRLKFAWPVPEWSSYLDLLRFNRGWEKYLDAFRQAANSERNLDQLAWRFLSLVVSVATYSDVEPWRQAAQPDTLESAVDWGWMHSKLKALREVEGPERVESISDWVYDQSGSFVMPEAGTSAGFARALMDVLVAVLGMGSTAAMVEHFRGRRWEKIRSAFNRQAGSSPFFYSAEDEQAWEEKRVDEIIARIDRLFPDHPWVKWAQRSAPGGKRVRPRVPGRTS